MLKSAEIYDDMLSAEDWDKTQVIEIPVIQKVLTKVRPGLNVPFNYPDVEAQQFSLLVIGICGFGFTEFSWNTPPRSPDGTMSIQEAINFVMSYDIFDSAIPNWAYWIPIPW